MKGRKLPLQQMSSCSCFRSNAVASDPLGRECRRKSRVEQPRGSRMKKHEREKVLSQPASSSCWSRSSYRNFRSGKESRRSSEATQPEGTEAATGREEVTNAASELSSVASDRRAETRHQSCVRDGAGTRHFPPFFYMLRVNKCPLVGVWSGPRLLYAD